MAGGRRGEGVTPAETLAAARGNVVGPYVPAREEWLEGCIVPIRWRGVRDGPWRMGVWGPLGSSSEAPVWGIVTSTDGHDVGYEKALDLTRPEVQDHLVRRGAPEWARKLPAALWVWAVSGKVMEDVLKPWEPWYGRAEIRIGTRKTRRCTLSPTASGCWEWSYDVVAPEHRQIVCATVETGPEGMACADLAALRAGCILEEPDGWLVPLPDGGIGFWPREGA